MLDGFPRENHQTGVDDKQRMTFILGSRCIDGVVMIADKKVTLGDCSEHYYENKLFGEIRHVIFGAAGSTNLFELYRGYVRDYIRTHPNDVTYKNADFKLAEFAFEIYKKYDFNPNYNYSIVVARALPDSDSNLTVISGNGLPLKIDGCIAIGSGQGYTKIFLNKVWHKDMTMEQVAELGYFIIKYIEGFQLNLTVGVNEGYPQIWFVPDRELDDHGEKKDYPVNPETRPEQFKKIKKMLPEVLKNMQGN